MTARDEFYVGYLPVPPGLHGRLRRIVLGLLLLAGPVGIGLAAAHTPSAGGTFEFGHVTTVSGALELHPLPALRVNEGGQIHRILLVDQGKHGVHGLDAMDGRPVTMAVTRIHRDRDQMYEVASAPVVDTGVVDLPAPVVAALGGATLRGEVVDGKCDLGVMNPGDGTLHRACAVRCLSGGVPPMLLVRDRAGREIRVALAGLDAPLPGDFIRQWAGAPVEIHGTLVRRDDAPILLVTEGAIRRLP